MTVALSPTRIEYRITLENVDRRVSVDEAVVTALHPSETWEHLTLRALAWCLLHEPSLRFGPGLSTPDAADLWAHDLSGNATTWIECGAASGAAVKKVVQHHAGCAVHAVFSNPRRRDELCAELSGWKRAAEITLWTIDPALVAALAAREERRHRWTVTVVGDHFYVDADGRSLEGAVVRGSPV